MQSNMCIPVRGLEEDNQERGPPKHGMQCQPLQEPMQRPCSACCELWAEPVSSDVLHLVLVGKRWHSACWVFAIKCLVQKIEIGESSPNAKVRFLEGLEVGLAITHVSDAPGGWR